MIDYLNSYYLEGVESLFAEREAEDHDVMALREFKWVLGKLGDGLLEDLDTSLEWVIKLTLIEGLHENFQVEEGLSETSAREAAVFQYTAVTDPLFDELMEKHGIRTIVSEADVERAFMDPPEESRGELRVALAQHFKGSLQTLSWSYLKLRPEQHLYPFSFQSLDGWTPDEISRKIAEIESQITKE